MTSTQLRLDALASRASVPAPTAEYVMHIVRNGAHVVGMVLEMLSKDDATTAQAKVGMGQLKDMVKELDEIFGAVVAKPLPGDDSDALKPDAIHSQVVWSWQK